MDYRLELLKEYRELLLNWDNNNMLYNLNCTPCQGHFELV